MLSPGDLLLAIRLVATPWKLDRNSRVKPVSTAIRRRDLPWLIFLKLFPGAFRRRALWLYEFIAAHQRGPDFWRDTSAAADRITAPDTLALVSALVAKANLPEARAWNLSIGYAQYILGAVAELDGADVAFCDAEQLAAEAANPPQQPKTRDEIYRTALADLGKPAADEFIRRYDEARRN